MLLCLVKWSICQVEKGIGENLIIVSVIYQVQTLNLCWCQFDVGIITITLSYNLLVSIQWRTQVKRSTPGGILLTVYSWIFVFFLAIFQPNLSKLLATWYNLYEATVIIANQITSLSSLTAIYLRLAAKHLVSGHEGNSSLHLLPTRRQNVLFLWAMLIIALGLTSSLFQQLGNNTLHLSVETLQTNSNLHHKFTATSPFLLLHPSLPIQTPLSQQRAPNCSKKTILYSNGL